MEQNPYPQQTTPTWFSDTPGKAPQKPPRNVKRLALFIFGLLIVGGIIVGITFINVVSRPGCLSKSDYAELAGAPYVGDLQPQNVFYTASLDFDGDTATLDAESASVIKALAEFYTKHQSNSIQFTIDSSFSSADDKAATLSRTVALQKALSVAGIPPNITVTEQPELIPSEESDTLDSPSSFTVSVTSLVGCR